MPTQAFGISYPAFVDALYSVRGSNRTRTLAKQLERSYNRLRLYLFPIFFTRDRHSICSLSFFVPVETISPPGFDESVIYVYTIRQFLFLSISATFYFITTKKKKRRREINLDVCVRARILFFDLVPELHPAYRVFSFRGLTPT